MLKKTTVWLLSVMMLMMMLVAGCGGGEEKQAAGNDSQKLIVYTSMKESLIKGIVDGFKKANPGIDVDYQSAGAGKLMAKIAAERQSGKILADVIWTSEVPDFYNMKNEGILLNYKSPVEPETVNPFDDYDGSFHAARLGTLGIVINTDKIKTAPGGRIGKGSGQVIDDTASGELGAALAVDYITNAKIEKGAHLQLCYPPELLVVPSPVAIFKDSTKADAAKKFVDYLLGKEAQTLVAQQGTIPVREDVEIPAKFNLPAPKEALEKSIKIDYIEAIKTKEDTIKKFSDIMQIKQ